jgi:hypothetical protein
MITYNSKRTHVIDEITRQGHSLMSINGKWVSSNDEAVQAIIDSFDELVPAKAEAKARIVEQSQAYMQQIESEYPSFERATWSTQKAEIEAWGLDSTSLTPLLDNIAIAREMDRVTLLNRTLTKVQAYNIQAAYLAGTRQKLEDEIDNSTDLDFISSINFEV